MGDEVLAAANYAQAVRDYTASGSTESASSAHTNL